MAIPDKANFKEQLSSGLGNAYTLLEPEQVDFAINQALNELSWTLPIKDPGKSAWAIKRAIRHGLDIIRIGAAHKFKYKQISLNQRFDHYNTIIKMMDQEFKEGLENDPALISIDPSSAFGVYVRNGFVYDQFGKDVTRQLFDAGYDIHSYLG